jgi:DNA mismatch repair protein MutS2
LAIARRLGFPEHVLATAESTLPQGERDIARLLLELEAKEQRLDAETLAAERSRRETDALKAELEARERDFKVREKDAERRARQQARDLLLKARAEVEETIAQLRGAAELASLDEAAKAARRRVEEAAKRQKEKAPAERRQKVGKPGADRGAAPAAAAELAPGLRVKIESLGRTGTVVEIRDGKAMVEAGSMRLWLPRGDLTPLPPGDQKRERARTTGSSFVPTGDARPEVDLRGMRVDEVETVLGRAIDDAILSGLPSFRIIHGKGTGALRAFVRELLEKDRRITVHRTGELFEGGTGVTVIEFA